MNEHIELDDNLKRMMQAEIENSYQVIPEHTKASLDNFVKHGLKPGGFLTRVLCNDLFGAYAQADAYNIKNMYAIIKYVYNKMPGVCWGSRDAMERWSEHVRSKQT